MARNGRFCFLCGVPTGVAIRAPGLRSQLPPAYVDKYLPCCPAHEAAAFARRDAKLGLLVAARPEVAQPLPGKGADVRGTEHEPLQRGFDL